jgi:glutathione synthase/RimK-type ligase-like ATP-grasp enzyme
MVTAVGVLCTRMRVEEKRMIQALAEAGLPARLLPPADAPLPIGPVPARPSGTSVLGGETARVIIDRCQNRSVAASILPLRRALGVKTLDAGLAATGTRAEVALALAAAGIPRPVTMLIASEDAGVAALEQLGYPATYLPLSPGSTEIALMDRDTAEAVFEHRGTLGGSSAAIGIVQAGVVFARGRVSICVVNGRAVSLHDPSGHVRYPSRFIRIAEAVAQVLGASIIGVELVETVNGPVVWDVDPTPEFRDGTVLGDRSVAEAIADLVVSHLHCGSSHGIQVTQLAFDDEIDYRDELVRRAGEVSEGVALSA